MSTKLQFSINDELSFASPALSRFQASFTRLEQEPEPRLAMAATGGHRPPPPPPPPPPVQRTTTFLQSSQRTSSSSNRLSNSSSSATSSKPVAGVDAATIQHAVAGLRKTANNESLRSDQSDLSNARVAGANRSVFERNWTDSSFNEPMERGQARNEIYAPSHDSGLSVSIGDVHRPANQVKTFTSLGDQYSERSQLDVAEYQSSPRSQQYSPYSNQAASPYSNAPVSPYSNISDPLRVRPPSPATVSTIKWAGGQRVGFIDEFGQVPANRSRPTLPVNGASYQYVYQRGGQGGGGSSSEQFAINAYPQSGAAGGHGQYDAGSYGGMGGSGANGAAGGGGGNYLQSSGGGPYAQSGIGSPRASGTGVSGRVGASPYNSSARSGSPYGSGSYNQQGGAHSPVGTGGLLSSAIDRIGAGGGVSSPYRQSGGAGGSHLGDGSGRSGAPYHHGAGAGMGSPYDRGGASAGGQDSYHGATSPRHMTDGSGGVILNPQDYIHAYATRTPAMSGQGALYGRPTPLGPTSRGHDPNSFAKELRDQGLTMSQRAANRFQSPVPGQVSTTPPSSLASLYQHRSSGKGPDHVDELTRRMQRNMATGEGAAGEYNCAKCGEGISNDRPGCTALNQTFHLACFTCTACGKDLAGGSFYALEGKPLCESDYMNTLEKCAKCNKPITEKLLRASGKAFHPLCFTCIVCRTSLDGVPFTVDSANNVHCVSCFHEKFAPRCAVCSKPIVPESEGERESVRVVAMDKSFHVNCYRCEDCGKQLSSKIEGHGCYPLDSHLYCKGCNTARVRALTANA